MSRFCFRSSLALLGLLLAGCASALGSPSSAASVNGHDISMASFNTQVSYMRATSSQSTYGLDVCSRKDFASLCHKLKQTALHNLINEELVREYAAAHHITISQADFNREWTVVYTDRFHGNQPVLRDYAKSVGLSVADLEDMVRQDMLQQAVMYRVTQTMPTSAPAVRFAQLSAATTSQLHSVQQALKSGQPFIAVAARLSANPKSPCSQQSCGEIGWVPDALLAGGERQMITAPNGALVGPLVTQSGFTLLLVEEHATRYSLTAAQELNLREQSFTRWLTVQARRATIHQYVAT